MELRPKLESTFSTVNDTIEDVSGGCVMHRYKGYKRKRRWGQLREEIKSDSARCIILFYKHDLANMNRDSSKEPKLKFEFEFTRQDFCGLEKGEHHDRNGTRRFICIITKEKHLIIEDAVMTASGMNHNVLGTWYQHIAQAMRYVNRWKVVESNPKLARKIYYLHVSSENVSECHSLEDKTRENRNCLVLRSWKLHELSDVTEHTTPAPDGEYITSLSFRVHDNFGNMNVVNITVEGTPNVQQILRQFSTRNGAARKTTTICPSFDPMDCHPNLVKIPKQTQSKGMRKLLTKTTSGSKGSQDGLDMQKAKKQNRPGNMYVTLNPEETKPPAYCNVVSPTSSSTDNPLAMNHTDPDEPSTSRHGPPGLHGPNPRVQVPPSLAHHSPTQSFEPDFSRPPARSHLPSNGWNSPGPPLSPPHLHSPGFDDSDLKKGPRLATQLSIDSDYQSGVASSILNESDFAPGRYVNMQRHNSDSEPPSSDNRRPNASSSVEYQNLNPPTDQPPAIPARDVHQPTSQHYMNLSNRTTQQAAPTPPAKPAPPRPPKPLSRPPSVEATTSQVPPRAKEGGDWAPPLPGRNAPSDEDLPARSHACLIQSSIQQGSLPPLNMDEEPLPYENSIAFEISISEVLQGSYLSNSRGRWLDLPHSVFVRIALGLEKEGITVGDWKAFAEALGLTFHHIQNLAGLMRTHPTLRPLEVLLLHWSRTQSPKPFTRANLREILSSIGRDDLAQIIPTDQQQ